VHFVAFGICSTVHHWYK